MKRQPIIRIADDGRDNLSLWERCRLIVEAGIRKYGDAGGLPVSGTGRARKKKIDRSNNKGKVVVPTLKNRYAPTNKDNADGTLDARKSDGKRHPRTR